MEIGIIIGCSVIALIFALVVFLAIKSTKRKGIDVSDDSSKGTISMYDQFGKAVAKEDIYEEISKGNIEVYDKFGKPIEKDTVLRDAPNGEIEMYDKFGKAIPKEVLMKESNNNSIDVQDTFEKAKVTEVETTETTTTMEIYDNFGKPVAKEDIYKEVSNGNIEMYDKFGKPIEKEVILRDAPNGDIEMYDKFGNAIPKEVMITEETTTVEVTETMETVETNDNNTNNEDNTIGFEVYDSFGKVVSKEDVAEEISKGNVEVYDINGNTLSKEEVKEASNNNRKVYDKKGNEIPEEYLITETTVTTIVEETEEDSNETNNEDNTIGFEVYDSFGKVVSKEDIAKEISKGNVEVYDINGNTLSQEEVKEASNNNKKVYDKKGNEIPEEYLITETTVTTTVEETAEDSNETNNEDNTIGFEVYDSFGKVVSKEDVAEEISKGNVEVYDINGNALSKEEVKEASNNNRKVYDKKGNEIPEEYLITETTVTTTVEETDEDELENVIEKEISLAQKQPGVITIQDQFGNSIDKEDIINEVKRGTITIQDKEGNVVPKEDIENVITKESFNIIDKFGQAIAKEVVLNEDEEVVMSMIDDFPEVKEQVKEESQRPILSVDEVSDDEDEEVDTDEEDEEETDSDEPSSSEELVTARISQQTGKMILIRYKKSFSARLNLTEDINKDYHTALKNKLLSYKKVKARVSWNYEAYNLGRNQVAKINVRGKSVFLYLALQPADYEDTKYRFKDCSHIKKYQQLPLRVKVKSKRGLKWAFELIEQTMTNLETVENPKYVPVSFYEKNRGFDALLDEGLIKEVIDSKTYENLTEINKEFLTSNKIRSIDLETIKNIEINEDVYQEVISNIKRPTRDGKKDIINVDTISKHYKDKEVVSLDSLKAKKLIKNNVASVKCLARGTLDKRLVFELDTYSKDAIKMILITGGKIQ